METPKFGCRSLLIQHFDKKKFHHLKWTIIDRIIKLTFFSSKQIWKNVPLHLLTNECFTVNGCHQNESKHLIKTSQSIINPNVYCPSINVLWSVKLHVCPFSLVNSAYTGTKMNMAKKWTSKSETFIYFRFITCKVKHFRRFFFILMIRAYS